MIDSKITGKTNGD